MPASSGARGRTLALSAFLVVTVAIVLERGGLPYLPDGAALHHTDLPAAMAFAALLAVHLVVRYARHYFLLAPVYRVPLARLVPINAIGMAFITFLPLRLGEVARPAMLAEKDRLSIWAVAGTISAERLLDGVFYSALLLAGLAVAPPAASLSSDTLGVAISARLLPHIARLAGLGFLAAALLMVWFRIQRQKARAILEKTLSYLSPRLATRVAALAEQLSDGLGFLERPSCAVPYLLASGLAISAHVVGLSLLSTAVGLPALSFSQAAVVLGVLALGFAVPNAPGFFGTVQLSLYAGLSLYVPGAEIEKAGSVFVFLFYSAFVGLVLLLAAVSLAVEWLRGRPSTVFLSAGSPPV